MITDSPQRIFDYPVNRLHPSEHNPRSDLGDLDGLIASVRAVGIIEPLVVEERLDEHDYDVIAGHRRLAAAIAAGVETVPCIERTFASQAERIEVMAIENLQRADLSPLDEARAFSWLADLGHTQRDIAERVGCNQSHVSKRLSLVKLPAAATELLTAGRLTLHQAEELARLDEGDVDDVVTEVDRQAKNWHQRGAEEGAELPAYIIDSAVDQVARKRKVAAAEEATKKSGLKRLKSKPYESSGDHRPCKRKEATHVYVDPYSGSIVWARTAAAEHKANGTFDATAPKGETEWERKRRESDKVSTQRTELLARVDPEVVLAVGTRDLFARLDSGHEVLLAPVGFSESEPPLGVIAYAHLTNLLHHATLEPIEGHYGYDEAMRTRATWAELASTVAVEAEVAELVPEPAPVVEADMFAEPPIDILADSIPIMFGVVEPAPTGPIVEGVGGPTLIFGEPMQPEWATKAPWPTYGGHVMHRLLRRIGDITEPDLLRHVMAYEAAHSRPETSEVVAAVMNRFVAIS